MKRLTIFAAAAILPLTGCTKQNETQNSPDNDSRLPEQTITLQLSTDRASYAPSQEVRFTVENAVTEPLLVRYRHLGDIVGEQSVSSQTWSWTPPAEDFRGYLVELIRTTDDGERVVATIGVDVSSDWSRFPRYGFLSHFGTMSQSECERVIANLNRHHINGVQFQDWHYKHHWPLGGTREEPLENYLDIASRNTSLTTLRNYIAAIHSRGMKAILYNLCFGVLDDAAEDGVKSEWNLYKDGARNRRDMHELGAPFKSSIYIVDPANPEWQEYLAQRNDDVYAVLDFDGYQIDQLGDRGQLYDWNGTAVNLPAGYASFISAMKAAHPDKSLVMNAVSSYGAERIAGTGKVDFCYNEVWGDESGFADLRRIIENNDRHSGNTLRTVFAAYMNYDLANSTGMFNTPGVLLTNSVMFALGGSHLELGEHMLGKEYFPNNNLRMSNELQTAMVAWYDFMVAYENLLRDGGEFVDTAVSSTDGKVKIAPWEPRTGYVASLCRRKGTRQVVHLLNFSQANSLSWRDLNGTMPEPRTVAGAAVEIEVAGSPKRVWFASPDLNGGTVTDLPFEVANGKLRTTLPMLKYWDMVVIEY